jgi:hypothetical protein
MASEDHNPQSAPGEESPGGINKRREKKPKASGPEIKPVRKVTLSAPDGLRLRRLLNAHQAKCGEDLTASAFFAFVINNIAAPLLEGRARTKNLFEEQFISSLGFGRESDKHPANDAQNP